MPVKCIHIWDLCLQSDLSIIKLFWGFFSIREKILKMKKLLKSTSLRVPLQNKSVLTWGPLFAFPIVKHMEAVFMFQTMCHEALCIHMRGKLCFTSRLNTSVTKKLAPGQTLDPESASFTSTAQVQASGDMWPLCMSKVKHTILTFLRLSQEERGEACKNHSGRIKQTFHTFDIQSCILRILSLLSLKQKPHVNKSCESYETQNKADLFSEHFWSSSCEMIESSKTFQNIVVTEMFCAALLEC